MHLNRAEEKAKATALSPAIRLEEISVFTYTKKRGDESNRYWKSKRERQAYSDLSIASRLGLIILELDAEKYFAQHMPLSTNALSQTL